MPGRRALAPEVVSDGSAEDRLLNCPAAQVENGIGGLMAAWLIWLAIAGLLGAAEAFSLAFVAGLVACAAVAASVAAAVGGSVAIQLVVFVATSFGSLAAVLPVARRRLTGRRGYRSGVEALTGRPAVVLTRVDGSSGTVRIGGEVWSARSYDETQVIAEGARVAVFDIDGATALVYPREF